MAHINLTDTIYFIDLMEVIAIVNELAVAVVECNKYLHELKNFSSLISVRTKQQKKM